MRRRRSTKPILIAGLLGGLLFAILAVPLGAQPTTTTARAAQGLGRYDSAREVTISGDIQAASAKHVKGLPVGMRVTVAGEKGTVTAHLGPYLRKEVSDSLHIGTPVEIVGATVTFHGKSYFLARTVSVGGKTITVRGKYGMLRRPEAPRTRPTKIVKTSKVAANGGAR
jgi:hypothetical protein